MSAGILHIPSAKAIAQAVAAGGVELGYAERTSDFSTTNTAATDIPSLSITFAAPVRPVILVFFANFGNTTAAFLGGVVLNQDGSDLGTIAGVPAALAPIYAVRRFNGLTPAQNYTFKARTTQGSAGTIQLKAGTGAAGLNNPMFIQALQI